MHVLITGADGFVAKNLIHRLSSMPEVQLLSFTRNNTLAELGELVPRADCIFHLAGVNRPPSPEEFMQGNLGLTQALCTVLEGAPRRARRMVVYTSSIQATLDHPYGQSKLAAETELQDLSDKTGIRVLLYRLPNVFGRWSRPNYNSAVATFCHNIARGLPIEIHDPAAPLTLVHVDAVVDSFVHVMRHEALAANGERFVSVLPQYRTTVGQVARWIQAIHEGETVTTEDIVQAALVEALRDTYQSMRPST